MSVGRRLHHGGVISSMALGALALGFLGSAHCAAMCGGFAAAGARAGEGWRARAVAAVPLHAGRIASYATAGAMLGALGTVPVALFAAPGVHFATLALASLVVFATGLRMAGVVAPTAWRPAFAQGVGRAAATAARHIGAPRSLPSRLALGALWGWAPCALVYAALPLALASGTAPDGALVMAAFGIGTIPALLGAGWIVRALGERSRRWAGVLLMALALAALIGHSASEPLFCIAVAPASAGQ